MGSVGKSIAKGFVKVATGGIYDLDSGKVSAPFSGRALKNVTSASDDLTAPLGIRGTGKLVSDALKVGTYGVVNAEKGRYNVPFSSAEVRDFAKGIGNLGSVGQARGTVDAALDTNTARLAGTAAGSVLGAAAGAGAGGIASGSLGGTAALAGGTAGGYAAQQVNQAGDANYAKQQGIADATQAQQELQRQQREALKQAEDAKLAVQTKEAEARRRRASKQVQTVLTGSQGLGGKAPVTTPTLYAAPPRRSVLG